MSDGVLHLLSLTAAVGGMFALALVNDGHWRQLFGVRPQTAAVRRGGKAAAAGMLCLSFGLCVAADPFSMALLVWPMLLAVAAASVATGLTLQARGSTRSTRRTL